MKNLVNVLVPVIVIGLSGFFLNTLNAQPGNPETDGTAKATIAAPLSIESIEEMEFGIIVANSGGDVKLNLDGTREVASGDVEFIDGISGTVQAAKFEVKGHPNATVDVDFDNSTTLTHTNGSDVMTLKDITSSHSTIDMSGTPGNTVEFQMGGTLEIGSGQQAGDYQGTFEVKVSYQ